MTKPKPKPPPPPVIAWTEPSPALLARFQADCAAVSNPNVATPFAGLEDAVSRLLPYHILGTEEGDDADVDETADGRGGGLLSSKREAWQSMCVRKSAEFHGRLKRMRERVEKLESAASAPDRRRPEEGYVLHSACLAEARAAKAARTQE
mmetsp:Transcript_38570/g.98639  ORF Transcript_38570/g.98639 Transcript_38570/m.98639 type:complete len:150 (+) Transcript_38570:431-880(+)|eukprot:jgi/Tetstr1/422729/TSEL_013526.t1